MPQVLQQLCASGCDCPSCRSSTWGGTEEHGAMAQRAYNHRSPFGVLQRRVQDPWTGFWYNPLPCVSSQSEHWKDGLIASSWWCYVFSMFFISSPKLFMSIRASNTQDQVEERQTWKLFIATTSNLKPCVKIDLMWELISLTACHLLWFKSEAAHMSLEVGNDEFLMAHGGSRFVQPQKMMEMKRKAKIGAQCYCFFLTCKVRRGLFRIHLKTHLADF